MWRFIIKGGWHLAERKPFVTVEDRKSSKQELDKFLLILYSVYGD